MQIRTAKDLGAAIRSARIRHRLTQAALARMINVDQARISTIERGSPGVAVGTVLRVLAALDATILMQHGDTTTSEHPQRPKKTRDLADLDAIANAGLEPWPSKR